MAKRMMILLVAMGLFTFALGFVKYTQIRAAIAGAAAFQPPPEAVTTLAAKEEPWAETLSAIGSLAAIQGVTVSAAARGFAGQQLPVRATRLLLRGHGRFASRQTRVQPHRHAQG